MTKVPLANPFQLKILAYLVKELGLRASTLDPYLKAARCPEVSRENPISSLTTYEATRLIRKLMESTR
jgi:hypothetical protein